MMALSVRNILGNSLIVLHSLNVNYSVPSPKARTELYEMELGKERTSDI